MAQYFWPRPVAALPLGDSHQSQALPRSTPNKLIVFRESNNAAQGTKCNGGRRAGREPRSGARAGVAYKDTPPTAESAMAAGRETSLQGRLGEQKSSYGAQRRCALSHQHSTAARSSHAGLSLQHCHHQAGRCRVHKRLKDACNKSYRWLCTQAIATNHKTYCKNLLGLSAPPDCQLSHATQLPHTLHAQDQARVHLCTDQKGQTAPAHTPAQMSGRLTRQPCKTHQTQPHNLSSPKQRHSAACSPPLRYQDPMPHQHTKQSRSIRNQHPGAVACTFPCTPMRMSAHTHAHAGHKNIWLSTAATHLAAPQQRSRLAGEAHWTTYTHMQVAHRVQQQRAGEPCSLLGPVGPW